MSKVKLQLIIVALPGVWQRVLHKLVVAHTFISVRKIVSGCLSASQMVKEYSPEILLIDSSIPADDAVVLVRNTKLESPQTVSVVITDTTHQQHEMDQAGADFTLPSFNLEAQLGLIFERVRKMNQDSSVDSKPGVMNQPES